MRRALEACTAALEEKVKEAAVEQADMIATALTSGKLPLTAVTPYTFKRRCIWCMQGKV